MSLPAQAVDRWKFTVFATVLLILGGLMSFFGIGQLEDPEFTVKTAVVITSYPGASAAEVELEVTDRIELALQEMPQVKELRSFSRAGLSLVTVFILPRIPSPQLPQVWDELRKKVSDIRGSLPPGANTPQVGDDFGDVYGFFLAVVGDGYTPAELEQYIDSIKKELSLVKNVARVDAWGIRQQAIILETSQARLSQLGLTMVDVRNSLQDQNVVMESGGIELQNYRIRIQTTGEFKSPEDIGLLAIRGLSLRAGNTGELIRVRDFATIKRGYIEPATELMRYNGMLSIGLAISNLPGTNAVDIGRDLDARIAELEAILPVGIEMRKISWQSDQVSAAINGFIISLLQAVAIVLAVLAVSMGVRTSIVVGLCGLVFVIVASMVFMKVFGIDLQRMSLGALVIAMGMMVDNAIVVADGVLVRLEKGMARIPAAIEAASLPAIPLLGATIIAVMTFYPIAASNENAGEYCATLFSVVGISLLISWVLSVTVTPLMCAALLPVPRGDAKKEANEGLFFRTYRWLLYKAMRYREIMVVGFLACLVLSAVGFGHVGKLFFPAAARAQFMVDYWAVEGTRIESTSNALKRIEGKILEMDGVNAVSTFVGRGPPRYYLPVDPESPYAAYGQLIVNTDTPEDVDKLIAILPPLFAEKVPEARIILRKFGLGPFKVWPVEARFSGPAVADPDVLRDLASKASAILERSPHSKLVRIDWRQRTQKLVLDFDERNARWASIGRQDIANATRRSYDGLPVGQFRERDKLIPILVRHPQKEREQAASTLDFLQVRSPLYPETIPLSQVTRTIKVEWEDPLIWRWDRRRAITVGAVPSGLAAKLRDDVKMEIEAIPLPPGYSFMWDGEFRSSGDAQSSLIPGMIPAGVLIALICVGLFNAFRPALIIAIMTPLVFVGVTFGLLVTGTDFGFVALLGTMSLVGMMIKNVIVLLDQSVIERDEGASHYMAIVNAAMVRLRPVVLAAGTTVLGVVPLLPDVFWSSLAVAIMFGLSFGTVFVMLGVPVFYAILYRLPRSPPE